MQLHTLSTTRTHKAARVGRGGTRGKTSGRGTKGQKARAGHKIRPEMRDRIKKLPKRRGHGKNRSRTVRLDRKPFAAVNLSVLEARFAAGDTVNPSTLVASGAMRTLRGKAGVKILGTGTLTKQLTVTGCTASASATKAIEAAGGTVSLNA